MDWVQDAPRKGIVIEIWRARASPYYFKVERESDSRLYRAIFGHPKEGEYPLVRCVALDEAQNFCGWVLRAYDRNYYQ